MRITFRILRRFEVPALGASYDARSRLLWREYRFGRLVVKVRFR